MAILGVARYLFYMKSNIFFLIRKLGKIPILPIRKATFSGQKKKKKVQLGYLKVQNIELQVSSKAV